MYVKHSVAVNDAKAINKNHNKCLFNSLGSENIEINRNIEPTK